MTREVVKAVSANPTVKVIGANGHISLGKQFAGRQVPVDEQETGLWLIRTATSFPTTSSRRVDCAVLVAIGITATGDAVE